MPQRVTYVRRTAEGFIPVCEACPYAGSPQRTAARAHAGLDHHRTALSHREAMKQRRRTPRPPTF